MTKNNKMKGAVVAGIVGVFLAGTASAAMNGGYVGGQLGWGNTHQNNSSNPIDFTGNDFNSSNFTSHDTGLAGRFFSGYQVNQNFAAELGVSKFSNTTSKFTGTSSGDFFGDTYTETLNAKTVMSAFAVDLVGKAILPLQNGFSLYAKAGAAYLVETVQFNGNTVVNIGGDAETDSFSAKDYATHIYPTFGVGASYDLSQNVSADLSWTRIQKTGSSNLLNNVDFVGLGLTYHLG